METVDAAGTAATGRRDAAAAVAAVAGEQRQGDEQGGAETEGMEADGVVEKEEELVDRETSQWVVSSGVVS